TVHASSWCDRPSPPVRGFSTINWGRLRCILTVGRGAMRQTVFSIISRALAIAAVALVAACAEAPPPAPPAPAMADRVVVHKSTRTLNLLRDGKVLAS